jgi:hypothetical protein
VAKLDHKAATKVSWTEFLSFLQNEGLMRELVNDAGLYGFGVKRLVEKERYKLARTNDPTLNAKAVEYYIEQLVFLRLQKVNLMLAIFENNQARVFDSRGFVGIQDIEFPFTVNSKRLKRQQTERTKTAP